MVTVDNRLIRRWYVDCTPDEPMMQWDLTDMRTRGDVTFVPVPFPATTIMVVYRHDVSGAGFGSNSLFATVSTNTSKSYRMSGVKGDLTKNPSYSYGDWGNGSASVRLVMYPGQNYANVQNPQTTDPGYAVPGTGQAWAYYEVEPCES